MCQPKCESSANQVTRQLTHSALVRSLSSARNQRVNKLRSSGPTAHPCLTPQCRGKESTKGPCLTVYLHWLWISRRTRCSGSDTSANCNVRRSVKSPTEVNACQNAPYTRSATWPSRLECALPTPGCNRARTSLQKPPTLQIYSSIDLPLE